MENGRIKDDIIEINEVEVKRFYDRRCKDISSKDNKYARYSITMLHNTTVSKDRDDYEKKRITPLLKIDNESKILDLGCGTGRWADAFKNIDIKSYVGIDFSQESIDLCKHEYANSQKYHFYCGRLQTMDDILSNEKIVLFNRALINGVFLYINDKDLYTILKKQIIN